MTKEATEEVKNHKSKKAADQIEGRDEKEKIEKEKIDYKDKYLRALADYQNLIKRTNQEKQEFAKFANEQFLLEVLPVYDNLKTALDHTDKEVESNGWAEGIRYVVKQFKDFLENNGVEEITAFGEKFDHQTMEALKGEGDRVKKVLKAGYRLRGKVIVAAKVELD